ncbi:MAG: hypothetical protein WCL16_12340, partial [bacterium]
MLKLQRRLFALWMLIGLAISAGAAVLGDAGPRASLLTAEDMHRISIGADYLLMSRDVEVGGAVQKLEFQAYGGELGVDVCPWLTAFLGAGSDVGRCGEEAVWGDNKMAWFAGLHADL